MGTDNLKINTKKLTGKKSGACTEELQVSPSHNFAEERTPRTVICYLEAVTEPDMLLAVLQAFFMCLAVRRSPWHVL